MALSLSTSQRFGQQPWRLIKEFCGIYGIKMDYTKVSRLSKDKLSKAYFQDAKLSLEPFEVSITYRGKDNKHGKIISLTPEGDKRQPMNKASNEGKALILKNASHGYKNRHIYESLANMVAPPLKFTFVW